MTSADSMTTTYVKHASALSVGSLFKDSPGRLLELLEANLGEVLQINPELLGEKKVVPLFPNTISLTDVNDFYGLLEDEIFSNYINLFLNLPIFSRRMTYRPEVKQFSLDPPIRRRMFRIDHALVSAWVLMFRMPYFLKSHLHLEYRFSFELLNDLYFDVKSLHLFHELKTPIGVNRFRIFLHSRCMAKLISFWMDAEKFRILTNEREQKECFNALEILYLKVGSKFEVPEALRKGILDKIEKEQLSSLTDVLVHNVPLIERIKMKEVDKIKNFSVVGVLLKAAQDEVMCFLRMYWIPRYFTRNGLPYTDSNSTDEVKIKSHLVWGEEHKHAPMEPIHVMEFSGQAPEDFDSMADKTEAPAAQAEENSIWNLDISKTLNKGRKEKKHLRKFTLFEQARARSFAQHEDSNYMKQLTELRKSYSRKVDAQKSMARPSHLTPTGNSLMPLGLPFEQQRSHSELINNLPIIMKAKHSASVSNPAELVHNKGKSRTVVVLPTLTKNVPGVNEDKRKFTAETKRAGILLPVVTEASTSIQSLQQTDACMTTDPDQMSMMSESDEEVVYDPYRLLKKVNPQLLMHMSEEQLNRRKWILGALAANAVSGKPLELYLDTLQTYGRNEVGQNELQYPPSVQKALNNLDCWERIERIRATSSCSYAGRRADEICQAGGWGGLDAPRLLPTYHHYLASVSGDLLETHLEPFRETKFVINNYLADKDKLGIDENIRVILTHMLKSYNVDDTWYALLQEHNLTQLGDWVMKYFVWDNERLLMNCTSSKKSCKHPIIPESRSLSSVQTEAFDEEAVNDLTSQYIFSPKSDKVWLSLFAIEVVSYRPAEVYFPPIPSTTTSVGCNCTAETLNEQGFNGNERNKNCRPLSTNMTESQADLAKLQDCLSSPVKRKKIRKPQIVKKIPSSRSFITPQSSGSNISLIGTGRKKKLYPSTFRQVLVEPEYFNIFMKYLELHLADEAEAPLINFWHQVEIMKSYKNIKPRKEKATSIHKKYLYTPSNHHRKEYLNVECPPLIDISEKKTVTPAMMVQAQMYVCKLLEEKWWGSYKNFMEDEITAKVLLNSSSTEVTNANISCGKDYRANIRYLWGIFTFDLINFQHGLRDKKVYNQFKAYLTKTAVKLRISKGKRVKDGSIFVVMNGLSIYSDRLEHDLDFFIEIDKWISLKCDMSSSKGKLTKEPEALLVSKSQAIVACYLKSAIPPKLRVNLSQSIVNDIEKRIDDTKKFHRGLFYNAILHMITLLLPFWKKFCFLMSAMESEKDPALVTTLSGHSISRPNLTDRVSPKRKRYSDDPYHDRMGHLIVSRLEGKDGSIKGQRQKTQEKALLRRDATFLQNGFTSGAETLLYSFNLQSGDCYMKLESGLEIGHPCEVFISPSYEEIEYLKEPLPRLRSFPVVPNTLKNGTSTRNSKPRDNSRTVK